MSKLEDLTGRRFGRLTIVCRAGSCAHGRVWKCVCECGNIAYADTARLNSGNTTSCGCYHKEMLAAHNKAIATHKDSQSRLYAVWHSMKLRCNCKTHKDYGNYGARGISICNEWQKYENFKKWALENGYDKDAPYGKCTIDRINVDGNYCPDNCRWVNIKIQSNNRRKKKC